MIDEPELLIRRQDHIFVLEAITGPHFYDLNAA